jgi:hypothetical protein
VEAEPEHDENYMLAERQHQTLLSVSKNIWKSSRRFDADASSNAKRSPFDLMVKENAL